MAQCAVLFSGLYAVRPFRDALAVQAGLQRLPSLFTLTFVVTLALVPLMGLALGRGSRRHTIPRLFDVLAISLLVVFALQAGVGGRLAATVGFVWLSVFNLVAIATFWTLTCDLFDPADARDAFGPVCAGGSVGAIAGPFIAMGLARVASPSWSLVFAALALFATGAVARRSLRATHRVMPRVGGRPLDGLRLLVTSPGLRGLALFLLLMTAVSTLFYFEQTRFVAASWLALGAQTRLFASIDLALNVLALVLQLWVTPRLLSKTRMSSLLIILPLVSAICGLALYLWPSLAVLVVAQVIRGGLALGVVGPAREVVYTHLGLAARTKGKHAVDTVVFRGGDAVAAWGLAGMRGAGCGVGTLVWLGVPLCLVWLRVAWRLGRGVEG